MRNPSHLAFPPRQFELLNLLGYHHLQHGNPDRALIIFDAMNVLRPGDLKVIFSLARACIDCKQPEQALKVLDSLTAQDSDDPLAWFLRGQALMQTGETAESAKAMGFFIQKRKDKKTK